MHAEATTSSIEASTTRILDLFQSELQDRQEVERQVETFVVQHAAHHRPIVLVTSGGTAVDLEVHSVRCLENFSTGSRGAASIEAFLRQGYAVVHLWRVGSASPYGRVVAELLGMAGHHGITTAAVGKLFVGAGDVEQDEEDQMVQAVLANEDPWLSDPSGGDTYATSKNPKYRTNKRMDGTTSIALHRRIGYSSRLQMALKERQVALQEGRLLTIPYRSVEEYLAKLQLSTMALKNSQALALVYLAAAVSDFYIPKDQRSEHKIQSSSNSSSGDEEDTPNNGTLTLTLQPVPKVIPMIRQSWAPDAFVCSFKLETDPTILREKAERAVQNYGSHMVVGNILETRYQQVMLLTPPPVSTKDIQNKDNDADDVAALPIMVQNWPMHTIDCKSGDPDSLEHQLVNAVIEAHFEYISKSCNGTFDKAGIEAVMRAHEQVEQKKRQIERELFWERIQQIGLEWAGVLAGALLSYAVSTALRRRMSG